MGHCCTHHIVHSRTNWLAEQQPEEEYPCQAPAVVEGRRTVTKITVIAPAVAQLLGRGIIASVLGLHKETAWK